MTERIFGNDNKQNENIGEASILLEGKGRVITIPDGLKQILLKKGWTNSRIYLVYDDKKDRLVVVNRNKLEDKINLDKEIKNAAGLSLQVLPQKTAIFNVRAK